MAKKTLKLFDVVKFELLDANLSKVQDDFGSHMYGTPQYAQNSARGLQVSIAATHAGIITRNHGFYLPDKMRKGAATFVENYSKPILLHHDDRTDAIGRVVEATYVDTANAVKDKFVGKQLKDSAGKPVSVVTDSLFDNFLNGKMAFGHQVDFVRSILRDNSLTGYGGLGYIKLIASIVDPDAIQKLLDGRYLTGSIGASTNTAVCSVCKTDWAESGSCEHRPGEKYDSAECFLIAGDLTYDEYSFVNTPADRYSRVIEINNMNGTKNNIEMKNMSDSVHEVVLNFPQYDSVQEVNSMGKKKETPTVVADQVTEEAKTVDVTTTSETTSDQTSVTDSSSTQEVTPTPVVDVTVDVLDTLMNKVLELQDLTDEEEDKLYELLWTEAEAAVKDGTLELDEKLLADAKLSAEKRKNLASSTFCGPGKSFPVPDCAHVAAARRLISRYKGPGSKDSILTCVARKAKALGCGDAASTNDSAPVVTQTTETVTSPSAEQVLQSVLASLGDAVEKPLVLTGEGVTVLRTVLQRLIGLVGKDALATAVVAEKLATASAAEKALIDEVIKQEELVGVLRDKLALTAKEYAALLTDNSVVRDSLVKEKVKTRMAKESQLSVLQTLKDSKVQETSLTTLTDEALDAELMRVAREVDMVKIVDKLGDGMSRTPQGTVIDPTGIRDQVNQEIYSVADLKKIEEQYMYLLFTRGQQVADAYKASIREEKLPKI